VADGEARGRVGGAGGGTACIRAEPACAERGAVVTKSAVAGNLDAVQAQPTRVLNPLGYRKCGRTFNRDAGEGVLQVVYLWRAGFPTRTIKTLDVRLPPY
jgi:hypothetical protein